ncbi:hypothetical protein JAAARDRAFT_30037 [Jaapia argillacea MUCL 33604]|uniref:Capsule synthesis protein CapA domain-containing protein n=1 Tax=Jaapia argillacea MUCL 33604 TaxID=933084 RepID=A0A067QHP4_9AGAM|nr:hypothetical protein JAAARDRAFT_30037 [Jaapia argillacea MUCL 33604]
MATPASKTSFEIVFAGDAMLGRLIDQLRPVHVESSDDQSHIPYFVRRFPFLREYDASTPWGDTLPVFQNADLNIVNLETSVTNHSTPWPNKMFNYRMHPDNIDFLQRPRIHYANLANNHTLDFCEEGLRDTVTSLKQAGISFTGAGHTRQEALGPAILMLDNQYPIHIYSASDHPGDWGTIPTFHHIDYTSATRNRLKDLLTKPHASPPDLKIFSVHWGPNYSWHPSSQIQHLARFLIDECGVDVVHGHSSHHLQGVEVHHGKLIIYGCGDLIDDYALREEYRNDLGAIWSLKVGVMRESERRKNGGKRLKMERLEIRPTVIKQFQTNLLSPTHPDWQWASGLLTNLSGVYGTEVESSDDRLLVDLDGVKIKQEALT